MRKNMFFVSISIIILVVVVGIVVINNHESALYKKYKYPNEDFFGKKLYSEIDYGCTAEEKKIGENIVNGAYEYVMTENKDIKGSYEMLFGWYFKDGYKINDLKINLITSKIDENIGHIWVDVFISAESQDGKIKPRSRGLELWIVEKKDNDWVITGSKSAP